MFSINDYVMYGKTGVCQVTGIESGRLIGKEEMEYYVLQPTYKNKTAIIKTPVHNERVHIRPVATKEEIFSVIGQVTDTESEWIAD